MILGRSANLYLGVVTAAVGLVWGVAAAVNTPFPPELAGLTITFLGTVIALLSGNDGLAVKKGEAAQARLASRGK